MVFGLDNGVHLTLTALSAPQPAYLRQGCNLVPAEGKSREFKLVQADGCRKDFNLSHSDALAFARAAAQEFGVGQGGNYQFSKELADQEIRGASEKVKGQIIAVDADAKKFTLKQGRSKPDVEVSTTESTVFTKGKAESSFEAVVVVKGKVEVELTNGSAVKVIGK